MQIDKKWLSRTAAQEGFVRDTLEKVYRLTRVLQYINSNPVMKDCLALKGGTAINLTVFNLPRLSVDIDLDYSKETDREGMLKDRRLITEDMEKYMSAEGYQKSEKSKTSYALDSMIFTYQNTTGINDNIKIEINYSMRIHIFPLVYRQIQTGGVLEEFGALSVDGTELFGSKIKALLDRTAPRDLYDVDNMIKYGLFHGHEEKNMLRKCAVFYMAVGNREVPEKINIEAVDEITWYRIKTDLLPVKRKKEKFDLEETKQRVKDYLGDMMQLNNSEYRFLQEFREKRYHPEYLFEKQEIVSRLEKHPMALWKMQGIDR
ncbi:MAG: nucleotidyl transferase AbiEii/AbiGii toxin family protein [Bacillus sp. (in: Bacteria)]|nr:nucleotidyl transferase AbiEii/AbiGii toxin family protein [Bacillus sp. (in: firmicutes)]MCM1427732.1 nucleotidyl transferase AbiEii/AbiGii toxin family protein [Eubacterium sp.]